MEDSFHHEELCQEGTQWLIVVYFLVAILGLVASSAAERGGRFSTVASGSADSDTDEGDGSFRRRPHHRGGNSGNNAGEVGQERGGASGRGGNNPNDSHNRKNPPKRPLQNFKTLQVSGHLLILL